MTNSRNAFHASPEAWKAARQEIHEKWLKQRKWNTNSTPVNGAEVCLALLYSDEDYYRTLQLAMALGDDDCNAATALAPWWVPGSVSSASPHCRNSKCRIDT